MDNPNDPRARMTLREFLDGPFDENFLADSHDRTRDDLSTTVNAFDRANPTRPPLGDIRNDHLRNLREDLKGLGRAPATVNKHLGNVDWMLRAAGPRDGRHKDALQILSVVPWVKPLHVDEKSIRVVTPVDFTAFYNACDRAVRPKIDGVRVGDWWRALILTAYTAIVRKGALLNSLLWSSVDPLGRRLTIEGSGDKVGRVRCKPLHDVALKHLLKIRTADAVVFRWRYSDHEFYRQWHRIAKAAGTSFGLHDLKRTALSNLAPHVDVATLQKLGDHSSPSTALRYYVNVPDERLVDAINNKLAIPQGLGGPNDSDSQRMVGSGS